MLNYDKDCAPCDDIKICTNLESYNKPLPEFPWYTPTFKWRLILNLKLQPQNDVKLWIEHNNAPGLAFHVLKIDKMNVKMEEICVKISSGYCQRYEQELGINIPIPIKQIIGARYLFIEPSIFKDFHPRNKKKKDSPKWNKSLY